MSTPNRVALVTGAGSGIGQAVAFRLAESGYRLALIDVDALSVEETAQQLNVESLVHVEDVANRERVFAIVDRTVDQFGRVDALVNAAGILIRQSVLEHTLEAWRRTLEVNLDGPFWLTLAFVRALRNAGTPGAIVNIASVEALFPRPNHIAYSTSKGALLMLTKAMALDLAPLGVRANAVGPGVIETGMNADLRADEVASSALRSQIPMARFGKPEEVAEVVAFLLSDQAAYVTGALVFVDGGWAAH